LKNEISSRKDDHIALYDKAKSELDSGFGNYRLEHVALPELDFSEIDTSVEFLRKTMNLPLIISSITGGGKLSEKINRSLSELANNFNIGFAVGSQACAINHKEMEHSFKVRKYAPQIPILANIGASQLNYGLSVDDCRRAIDMIEADALIFHLNPLHEIFQTGGTTNFSGILGKIENMCSKIAVPIIVKEVGYGISYDVANKLCDVGVYAIDLAGAGSISWTEIEKGRSKDIIIQNAAASFADWGIPTTECIRSISKKVKFTKIIASGGINTGVEIAKAIALGADLCGNASGFLSRIMASSHKCENYLKTISLELKTAMFCTGSRTISALKMAKIDHLKI
jgi:isopentenyl-diphosphate delta-isomerase